MVDVHCHILPGIDDGAKDWETALQMARLAEADGIRTIVATPHHRNGMFDNDVQTILRLTDELNERLQEAKIGVTVLPGAETHYFPGFIDELQAGKILPLNRSKYVYIELPHQQVPRYIEDIVFEIIVAGCIPIIPHPERNREIRENPDLLYALIDAGALSQVTAGSLTGHYGSEVEKFSVKLFEHHLSHFVASDGHGVNRRKPVIREAYARLEMRAGEECVMQCQENAARVVEGRELSIDPPVKIRRRKLFGLI